MPDFDGNIDPAASWADVPQLSTTAPNLAGPGGPLNAQAVALTARTEWLLDRNVVTTLTNNAGVVDIDLSLGDYFTLELTANVTSITFSNLPGSGRGFSKFIQITQTGAFTVDWPASFRWEGGSAGAVSGSAAVDLLAITSVDNGATIHATISNNRSGLA